MRKVLLAAALAVLAACPHGTRHTLVPKVPDSGDAHARQRFEEARARFERDRSGGDEMAAIARDYPDDPVAPFARLYAGIADVDKGDFGHAQDELAQVTADARADAGLRTRAALFLGIADASLGKATDAIPLLADGEKAIENDDERGLWTASSATAAAGGPHPLDALAWFDRWWPIARPAERGYILARAGELVGVAPDDQILAAWSSAASGGGVAAAVLGPRAVDAWSRRGATGQGGGDAKQARAEANAARTKIGLPPIAEVAGAAEPDGSHAGLIGAALPLGGKQDRVAEQVLHGLAIAAGALGGPAATTALVRDAAGGAAAAAAVDAFADAGVMAVIGALDADSVDGAGGRAGARGVPLLALDARPDARKPQPFVFFVMHSAEARARTLARRAFAKGATKVAIFAPDSGYGKAVARAFTDAFGAAGGTIVTRFDYKNDTKSFADEVTHLGSGWDAVFIPAEADQLALIVPALDAAGMSPRPWGTRKVKGGRPILVLATAENAGPDLIHDAGRHLYGAWLACGFYPDATDPVISDYVARYLAAFAKAPTVLDAYAYDAAIAVAKAQAGSRADLAGKLAAGKTIGVTGEVRFDADRRRADDGVIFQVEDDGQGGARVKAVR